MNGSHFIAQTSKFLLIDATAVILGQGHGKVNQYISPETMQRRTTQRKRTENIKSPQTGVT